MKQKLFGLLMTTSLLAPTITFASEEISDKQENTDATVQTKLTRDGGRNESEPNKNSIVQEIFGETDLEKSWGYYYVPGKMGINDGNSHKKALLDEGEQKISILPLTDKSNVKTFLGVKNKSRQTSSWQVTAKTDMKTQLGEKASGITFDIKNAAVRDRYKNWSGQSAGYGDQIQDNELEAQNPEILNKNISDYDGNAGGKVSLNSDASMVFKGKEGIVHNGFYSLELSNCEVIIPDTRRIQNDNFNCQITWNLAKTPGAISEE